jgi:hypothetical protein
MNMLGSDVAMVRTGGGFRDTEAADRVLEIFLVGNFRAVKNSI